KIEHPEPHVNENGEKGPLYYKITLHKSTLGLSWKKRYEAGILFNIHSPEKRLKPTMPVKSISVNTTIFREASPEVAEFILGLKEIVNVENVWTEEDNRRMAKELLGKRAKTPDQVQRDRGFYVDEVL